MKRWVEILMLVGVALALPLAGQVQSSELRVRMGEQGSVVMKVRGIDAAGRIVLQPELGESGEALIPLPEARGLQFLLPDNYRKAQQLAFAGRTGEAVFLMRRIVPALVPYAAVPESNATGIVRFYFTLLLRERAWSDAIALAVQLPMGIGEADFVPDVVELAKALRAAGRVEEVVTVMEQVRLDSPQHRKLIWELADEVRRGGHWRESQVLYEKLSGAEENGEVAERLKLLLAYTDWHLGSDLSAPGLLSVMAPPPVDTDRGVLYRLLEGKVALAAGEAASALDQLAEALLGIEVASEWRVEITAAIADAYRAHGRDDLAAVIESDLRRFHPSSRWITAISD